MQSDILRKLKLLKNSNKVKIRYKIYCGKASAEIMNELLFFNMVFIHYIKLPVINQTHYFCVCLL